MHPPINIELIQKIIARSECDENGFTTPVILLAESADEATYAIRHATKQHANSADRPFICLNDDRRNEGEPEALTLLSISAEDIANACSVCEDGIKNGEQSRAWDKKMLDDMGMLAQSDRKVLVIEVWGNENQWAMKRIYDFLDTRKVENHDFAQAQILLVGDMSHLQPEIRNKLQAFQLETQAPAAVKALSP